jgi:hypothetical protein
LTPVDTAVNPKITANLPSPALLSANVWGNSPNGNTVGVAGSSVSADGVWGTSTTGNGVSAVSTNSNGIYAKGKTAGLFDGDVTVNGNLSAQSALSAASLKTSGDVKAGSLTTSGALTAGSVMTSGNVTANDVMLTGADLAEDFLTADVPIEPGSVVVINDAGALGQSSRAYDKRSPGWSPAPAASGPG